MFILILSIATHFLTAAAVNDSHMNLFVSEENPYYYKDLGDYPVNFPEGMYLQGHTGVLYSGPYEVQSVADGPGRLLKLEFHDGQVLFNDTLMINDYTKVVVDDKVWPTVPMFMNTIPSRPDDAPKVTDSPCYTMPIKVNGKYYFTTDAAAAYEINPSNLSQPTIHTDFKSHYKEMEFGLFQTTHIKHGVGTNDANYTYGIDSLMTMAGLADTKLVLFKINNDAEVKPNSFSKTKIHSVSAFSKKVVYSHDFSLGKQYGVAAIQPVHADVNVKKMMSLGMNNLFFNTMFSMDNTTTKLVVFPLDKKKSPIIIPLDISLLFMHYTYNYMEKNTTTLVFHATTFPCNALASLSMNAVKGLNDTELNCLASAQTYEVRIDLKTQSAKLIRAPIDTDLITLNPNYHGLEYCHLYGVTNPFGKNLVKYNTCDNTYQKLNEPGVYYSEPMFIPAEGATEEDDGYILTQRKFPAKNVTKFTLLDARTLIKAKEYDIPHTLSFSIHGKYFKN